MAVKTVKLTTRPSRAKGRAWSYQGFINEWVDTLTEGHNFKAASISGRGNGGHMYNFGRMAAHGAPRVKGGDTGQAWVDALKKRDDITFVIYSYDTPLAVWSEGMGAWIMPELRYSVTTSKQQSLIRSMIGYAHGDVVDTISELR